MRFLDTVIVSPELGVVIPASVCRSLGIESGQELQMIQFRNRIELIPVKPMSEARGSLRGIDTSVDRELDRT